MALIVETGSGDANANAYISASDMQAYFALVGVDLSSWGTPRMEARIALATRYMVATYRHRWQGRRVSYQQALDWPRYGVLLSLGGENQFVWYPGYGAGWATANQVIAQNFVPAEIKAACAEYAYRADLNFQGSGGSDALLPDIAAGDAVITREAVGPIEVSYGPGRTAVTVYSYCELLLRPYMMAGDQQTRLVRG